MSLGIKTKDPDAKLDYGFDWRALTNGTGDTDWLDPDEDIASAVWTIPDGLTKESEQTGSDTTVVWLSGGTAGEEYLISCKITTDHNPPRIDERSMTIIMEDR